MLLFNLFSKTFGFNAYLSFSSLLGLLKPSATARIGCGGMERLVIRVVRDVRAVRGIRGVKLPKFTTLLKKSFPFLTTLKSSFIGR